MKSRTLDGLVAAMLSRIKQGYSCKSAMYAISNIYGKRGVEHLKNQIRYEIKKHLALQANQVQS